MTEVSYNLCDDRYVFECVGHTGYAARGSDILCSAVSVLCYTLEEYLDKMERCGRISHLVRDFRDGAVFIEFSLDSDSDLSLLEAADAILDGFRTLSDSYPEYIRTDF